jgi:hypothetical protein
MSETKTDVPAGSWSGGVEAVAQALDALRHETLHAPDEAPGERPVWVATTGRIVHYREPETETCWAALVTVAHSATCCDLCVFYQTGLAFRTLVLHTGEGTRPGYDPGSWHWPERV